MATELDQLLVRRTGQPRPEVPRDWNKKPGIFSGQWKRHYPPWASYSEARLLIAHGMIAEGRALQERLMGNDKPPPRETSAACLDLLRPPADIAKAKLLANFLPKCEAAAFNSLIAWDRSDSETGLAALKAALDLLPASDGGAVPVLLAWLAWSDSFLQLHVGLDVHSMTVISSVKGCALLMLREHRPAWESFASGAETPMKTVEVYREKLGVNLDRAATNKLCELVRSYCAVGRALVLYDLCFDAESKAELRSLRLEFSKGVGHAIRMLF